MLDSTVDSINSALKRARASLQRRRGLDTDADPLVTRSSAEQAVVAKFVRADESADLDAVICAPDR